MSYDKTLRNALRNRPLTLTNYHSSGVVRHCFYRAVLDVNDGNEKGLVCGLYLRFQNRGVTLNDFPGTVLMYVLPFPKVLLSFLDIALDMKRNVPWYRALRRIRIWLRAALKSKLEEASESSNNNSNVDGGIPPAASAAVVVAGDSSVLLQDAPLQRLCTAAGELHVEEAVLSAGSVPKDLPTFLLCLKIILGTEPGADKAAMDTYLKFQRKFGSFYRQARTSLRQIKAAAHQDLLGSLIGVAPKNLVEVVALLVFAFFEL